MEETRKTIERLLAGHIVSLETAEDEDSKVVCLTYMDAMPVSELIALVKNQHPDVIFGEVIRVYSEAVIQKVYSRLYDDSEYERYWEDPEVGARIDEWLNGMMVV